MVMEGLFEDETFMPKLNDIIEQSFEDLGTEFLKLKERQCKGIREREERGS